MNIVLITVNCMRYIGMSDILSIPEINSARIIICSSGSVLGA